MAFVVASVSLVLVFASAGAPIPMFHTFSVEDGITNGDLAVASVGYFVAAATALLVFGRLSDFLGRRSVSLAALLSTALASLILIVTHDTITLSAARILQGLACGLASSALGTYIFETAPKRPAWLSSAVTGCAPMLGIPIGAIASGALLEFGPAPRLLIYALMAGVLFVCAGLMALSPETASRRRGAVGSLRPRIEVPAGTGRLLVVAGSTFIATWSLGGYYQAFSPSLVAERLGSTSPLVAAAAFSSVMILNPLGSALSGRLRPVFALRFGMLLFVVALGGIVASLGAGAIVPFVGTSLLVGVAQGAASTGAIRALLTEARPHERAGLLSAIYLIAYSGAAVPGMIAREFTGRFDLYEIAVGYAVLGALASVVAVLGSRIPHPAFSNQASASEKGTIRDDLMSEQI